MGADFNRVVMSLEKNIQNLRLLDQIIAHKRPGDATAFARELGISRRTFFRLIILLRQDCGAPVVYNRRLKYYYYESSGMLVLRYLSPSDVEGLVSRIR